MEYMVLSYFQIDSRSNPEWEKCFVHEDYNKCVDYCKEKKAKGSFAEYYIYPEGEYPMGYLICHNMFDNYEPLFHC